MTSKTRRLRWLSVFVLILTLVMGASQVLAVDNKGLFELDGNAQAGAAAGDDWSVFYPSGSGSAQASTGILVDGANAPADTSYYTGGGSKDDLDITSWQHTTGDQAPDKDEITNAYAAAYSKDGDLILYFGADRYANNGDAALGFWFFNNRVSLGPNGAFSGQHAVGDVLIISHFSNGGQISTIDVYEWVGTGGNATANGTLQRISSGSACDPNNATPVISCALVNTGNTAVPAPWPYTPKQGQAGSFPKNSFFEGGFNVTQALGFTPCFSSFLAETRSSTSVDAQLKDFSLGQFPLCGLNIDIDGDGVNEVGQEHTFTVTVEETRAGVSSGVLGAKPNVTLTGSNGISGEITLNGNGTTTGSAGDIEVLSNTCASPAAGTNSAGECEVTFKSDKPGKILGSASVSVTLGGLPLSAQTGPVGSANPPAQKLYVDAFVTIDPSAVNEVGDPHTFTVTVKQHQGTQPSSNIADYVNAPDGTPVTVTLTDSNGADSIPSGSDNTCASQGTVNGQCTVTFTSNTPGTVTGHASVTLTIGGLSVTRDTDAQGDNSDDAVKKFVDAFITIGEDAVNNINDPHTFTVTVKQHEGTQPAGIGSYVNAPDNTPVTIELTPSQGAQNPVPISSNTCASPGTVNGQCTVTFTSNTPGIVIGHAEVTLTIGGVSISRETQPRDVANTTNNSTDAEKIFVGGSLTWLKHDNAGRLLAGATFEVCRTHDFNLQSQAMVAITPVCISVEDDSAAPAGEPGSGTDEDAVGGQFKLSQLTLGRYTVAETAAPPGYEAASSGPSAPVDLTFATPDQAITVAFVNNRPTVKLTGFGYTNDAVGTPTDGVVTGTTTFTVKLKNYGAAATTVTAGTLSVAVTGQDTDTDSYTCDPATCSQTISGTLAPGEEKSFTLTINYNNFADGAKVTASLSAVQYTTNGLARSASGTPAEVFFTVQAD